MEQVPVISPLGKPPALPAWKLWWRAARPFSLTASIVPVLVGGALAAFHSNFSLLLFLEMLVASILIQIGANYVNEYYDYVKGLDTVDSIGIGGVIVSQQLPAKTVLRGGLVVFAIAVLIGIHISMLAGWEVFAVGLICILSAYVYTGGPWPIAYTPFGEIQVFIFMGLIMVGLSYYIHTSTLNGAILLTALPVAGIVAAILLSNNIRDIEEDTAIGRRTIAVLYGKDRAHILYRFLLSIAYFSPPVGVALGWLPWPALLPLITFPQAIKADMIIRRGVSNLELAPAVPITANLHGRFGILLAAGIVIGTLFS